MNLKGERPDDWNNPYFNISTPMTTQWQEACKLAYEAGASAMLAARDKEWVAGIENIFGRCECVNDGQCTGCRHYKYGKCIYFLLQQLKQSMGVEE